MQVEKPGIFVYALIIFIRSKKQARRVVMFNKRFIILVGILAGITLLLASCNFPGASTATTPTDIGPLYTMVAQTLAARMTDTPTSGQTPQSPTTAAPTFSATVTTGPIQLTPILPTQTSLPPTIANTQVPPTSTQIPIPCNRAQYIKDVTVPDGTIYTPGVVFTKTWQFKNIGSCEWTSDYRLIFASGKQMAGSDSIALPGKVRPGESVNLSIELTAPSKDGKYRGYWMLRSANGQIFGIGSNGDEAFWVEIRVFYPPDLGFQYDFAANFCNAAWRSGAGKLACPTTSSQEDGSINLTDQPVLENGRQENEFTLLTSPEQINNGYITGTYPVYNVKTGDHFLADVGCLNDNQGCDVTFFIDGILSDGRVLSLGAWNEAYDGRITRINIDLSSLNGQNVRFVLGVRANSRPGRANAFWLVPSIRAIKATPTPTQTSAPPTATPTTTQPAPTATPSPTLPSVTDSPAADAARRTVATALGIDPSQVIVRSIEASHWTDTCFGIAATDQNCAPASVDGFRIIMSVNTTFYEARTNQDGSIVLWFPR